MSDCVKSLTVITVSYHDLDRLRRTVQSLIQFALYLDHLIILPRDDFESIQFLEDLMFRNPKKSIRFSHDEGFGIYEAMSFGVKNVRSRYFTFWNSGDELFSSIEMNSLLVELSQSDANWILVNGHFNWIDYPPPSKVNLRNFIRQSPTGYLSHQCVLFRTDFFRGHDIFNFKYKVAADTDQIYRCYLESDPLILDYKIVSVEVGAFSAVNHRRARFEILEIIIRRLKGLDLIFALFNFFKSNFYFLLSKCNRFRLSKFTYK